MNEPHDYEFPDRDLNPPPVADDIPSAAASMPETVDAMVVRYCTQCGNSIDGTGGICSRCNELRQRIVVPAHDSGRTSPALMDTIGLYSVFLVTFVPAAVLNWSGNENPADWALTEIAVGVIDAVLVLSWAVVRRKSLTPLLVAPFNVMWLMLSPLLACGSFILATVFLYLVGNGFGVEEIRSTDSFVDAGYGLTWMIVVICLQPAIIEELAFRGIILNGLMSILSIRDAIIVSSLMFAVLHLSAFGLPQLVLGVLFAWMRLKTGSLLPGMATHFFHNLLCVMGELYWS